MSTRKFTFQNKSGEVFPAFACGKLAAIITTDTASKQPIYQLVKPDGDLDAIYVVNGPQNIADNGYGVAVLITDATLVLIEDGESTAIPEFGDTCGPAEGYWAATKDGTGLRASGELNNGTIPVTPVPAGSGAADPCPCVCLENGDAVVNGIITTSKWSIAMNQEKFKSDFGTIFFPAGDYVVELNDAEDAWELDIGDVLTAKYNDGTSATEDTTMDGTLTMTWGIYGPVIELCVDGAVPDPEDV